MMTGDYSIQQQCLSSEAAILVEQSMTIAARRDHAEVTPLHVATAMLASSNGLFRRSCLQQPRCSHPLQCRALELCFNVALNRLPTTTSPPSLDPHSHFRSLSNALVAAFNRAGRGRGSTDNHQQQPILKVEIQQLLITILDDPSVCGVMHEAGFSSTQVKASVTQSKETKTSL